MVHGLEAEYNTRLDFIYLDRDDPANRDLLTRLNARYQPIFYFLDAAGNVVQRWDGCISESEFRSFFDAYLAENPS